MQKKVIDIFLVDDDHDDVLIFGEALLQCSFEARLSVFNLCEAICDHMMLESVIIPDVIFLDINMPLMNGIDCLTEIRKNKDFSKVPVVIFSTSNRTKDVEAAFKIGANLYLTKPYSISELVKMIKWVVQLLNETGLVGRSWADFLLK